MLLIGLLDHVCLMCWKCLDLGKKCRKWNHLKHKRPRAEFLMNKNTSQLITVPEVVRSPHCCSHHRVNLVQRLWNQTQFYRIPAAQTKHKLSLWAILILKSVPVLLLFTYSEQNWVSDIFSEWRWQKGPDKVFQGSVVKPFPYLGNWSKDKMIIIEPDWWNQPFTW